MGVKCLFGCELHDGATGWGWLKGQRLWGYGELFGYQYARWTSFFESVCSREFFGRD